MLNFNYGSPYFWDKVVLTKFINCSRYRMVWDLICGTSWFYKSKTEKVTGGGKSAILPIWCCLLSITVPFTHMHRLRTPREEIAFTERPKIHSHSQIFRYGRSIFCLPHRPKFSDFFDLCLHWVSVVRAHMSCKKF